MYFLNSIEFDLTKIYINPMSIDSIRVDKKSKNAKVYFFTKKGRISLMTLEDLLNDYTDLRDDDGSILYCINDEFVGDINGIKIDKSYFVYVDVFSLSGMQYLSDNFKGLKIVEIDLEKEKRKPEIRIRGNQEITEILNN